MKRYIIFAGVNGAGKTTLCGKCTYRANRIPEWAENLI